MAIAQQSACPLLGRRLTVEEFLALPEVKPYLELREGIVTQKALAQEEHGLLEAGFGAMVNGFGRPRGLAVALSELRGTYGDSVLVPDLAMYRWDRLERNPEGRIKSVYVGPPDAVVEFLSPGQRFRALVEKSRVYLAHGVQVVLLVDPRQDTIRVIRADGGDVTLRGDDRIDLDALLPGFELTPRMVFETLVG